MKANIRTLWFIKVVGQFDYVQCINIQKGLNDPDNHNGVVTHLEPDILECEVKWALGSIIMNKAIGGDRIPAELFQILKDDAVKVLHSVQSLSRVQLFATP